MTIGIICCKVLEKEIKQKDYTRAFFIDTQVGEPEQLLEKAQMIAKEFNLRLETTQGSLAQLENTLMQALNCLNGR